MQCFVIMPFADEFDAVYAVIRSALATATGGAASCRRLDEIKAPGRITDDLVSAISDADLCVADLTGLNANVMWEVGYATALSIPVILLSRDVDSLPFDIRHMRTLEYSVETATSTLHDTLVEAIRSASGGADHSGGQVARRILARGTATPLCVIGEDRDVVSIDGARWAQELRDVEIILDRDRVRIDAAYHLSDGAKPLLAGRLRGTGIVEAGRAYLSYRITDASRTQCIAGVLKLVLPQFGSISGHYLAESYAKTGRTVLGAVSLERI